MKRILIADDDAEMRDILQLALADRFDVALAANGFDALRRLESDAFDAVLLDLNMPVLDGRGVIREMRRRGIAVPILIVSGEANLPRIAAQLDVGDFLAKPVALHHIRDALETISSPRKS